MPQTYEASDPKTGKKWTWDGKKWNEVPKENTFNKFESDVTSGMGWDPEKLKKASRNGGGFTGQLSELTNETVGGINHWMHKIGENPGHILDPLHSMASTLLHGAGVPDKPGDKWHAPVPGEFVGGLANVAGGIEGAEAVSKINPKKIAKGVVEAPKKMARGAFGVGGADVRIRTEGILKDHAEAQKAHQEKVENIQKQHAEKVKKVEEQTSAKIADALKKRVEASAKETAAKTKQEALTSKHGPVYKRMNEMAENVQQGIGELEQKVKQKESEKWQAFNSKLTGATVKTQGVVDTIAAVRKNILTGENLPVFKQVMDQIFKEEGAPEYIDREIGLTPKSENIPLDLARRLYTKISRKLYGSELPKDVARAMGGVLDSLDEGISSSIADVGGVKSLGEYRKLQADWKKYRQTFSDKDSPLRKIAEAKDPHTKLNPLTSETGARAIEYLGRYKDAGVKGAQPERVGRIRALHKALKELPGGGGKMPDKVSDMKLPEQKELPAPPEKQSTNPEDVRRELLQKKAMSYSQPLSKWEMMNPKLLLFRKMMKHIIQNPGAVDWLSKSSGGSSPTPVP